jgi:hypothetical protein
MPADLPEGVAQQLMTSQVSGALQTAGDSRNVASLSSQTLQAGMVSAQNSLALTVTGRTVSAVVATPIASPTEQAKP